MQLDEIGRDIHYQLLNNVFRHKGVPMICPSAASQQGAKTLCIHPIWMWDAVNRGLQPQQWSSTSYRLGHAPFSLKFTPTWTMYSGIRVFPYAHLQRLKVLKHFVFIQYGCGMQSMGVFSLNHDTTTSCRFSHTPFPLKFTPTCTHITA